MFLWPAKKINGCIGCTRCAADSFCKVEDDWQEIGRKMLKAEAIIFGAPDYYDTLNALAHACLERTYCFRHLEKYKLAGKLGVGIDCASGTVVDRHGFFEEIEKEHLPLKLKEQKDKKLKAYKIAKTLGSILEDRNL
jgi:multimeric flavodoxin WrbA